MRLIPLLLVAALIAGCPDDRPPVVPVDTSFRDVFLRLDGGMDAAADDVPGLDAPADDVPGLDAPGLDVPGLDAPLADVPPFDVGPIDAGPLPDVPPEDAGPCFFPDGGYDFCGCSPRGAACPGGTCASPSEVCLDDGCGDVCVPSGAECVTAADCPAGSACTSGTCVRSTPGCTDSRDCPLGFACTAGVCVDHRIGCTNVEDVAECPYGFYCEVERGPWFCARFYRPCSSDGACPPGGACVDADGDGDRECLAVSPGVMCDGNADCSGDETCTSEPVTFVSGCGRYGTCRNTSDCFPGQLCADLWGDGVRQCIDPGACDSVDDCPGAVCGTPVGDVPLAGGPTECIDRPFPL